MKRRTPKAQVLYLTAERFRYQFVEAVRSQDAMAFKDKFRAIDILLIDDLEFMQGEKTEQEFEHIINALLDGGRQVVVASARPPGQLDRLNDRMRSRMQRGLITEISDFDERAAPQDPRAARAREARERPLLRAVGAGAQAAGGPADRERPRARRRGQPPLSDLEADAHADHAGFGRDDHSRPGARRRARRIKVEDILRIVSRHFAVPKAEILSDRRHRSVVRPRQIGMYLAKQLTSRSLPEIGRRFGNRDHTTVLHAIRKIDKELGDNPRLKDEIEELKRQLNGSGGANIRPPAGAGGGCSGAGGGVAWRRSFSFCVRRAAARGRSPCKLLRRGPRLPRRRISPADLDVSASVKIRRHRRTG